MFIYNSLRYTLYYKVKQARTHMLPGVIKLVVKNKVKLIHNQTSYHCALIERFQRSMQRIIYQYCTDKSTYKFYDKLPLLLKTYNCRPNRSLGHQISPEMAESGNHDKKISEAKSKYLASFKRKSPKYKVNDFVRIRSEREKFYKSYRPTFNDEIFRIIED